LRNGDIVEIRTQPNHAQQGLVCRFVRASRWRRNKIKHVSKRHRAGEGPIEIGERETKNIWRRKRAAGVHSGKITKAELERVAGDTATAILKLHAGLGLEVLGAAGAAAQRLRPVRRQKKWRRERAGAAF